MERKYVFVLAHYFDYGEDSWYEEVKILGIYNNMGEVNEAINRYRQLKGFVDYEDECFSVGRYVLDEDESWKEGFITAEEA